jgi:hypothetical protein
MTSITITNTQFPTLDHQNKPMIDASTSDFSKSTFVTLGKRARQASADECDEYVCAPDASNFKRAKFTVSNNTDSISTYGAASHSLA